MHTDALLRLERILDDLLWLATNSGVDLASHLRDAIGELRHTIDTTIDGEVG